MGKVRVRFAPSPTGGLHIGGVRTALYNYLFAKSMGGDFLLRIEDTDQKRYVAGAEQYIKDTLSWIGIEPVEGPEIGGDFGPYRQSERKEIYQKYAQQLLDSGHAYKAFDTPEELDTMRDRLKEEGVDNQQYNAVVRTTMKNSLTLDPAEVQSLIDAGTPYVIRLKMPVKEEIRLEDMIRGWVNWHSSTLDDKVIVKADGMPTYHLASVVDDHLMKISHIIRGEEWLPSAPLHVMLYRYLGWEESMPQFAHLPLILKPTGKGKLSKRDAEKGGFPIFPLNWEQDGELSEGFKEAGYLPEALLNFLALLGWNPGNDEEKFSLTELCDVFKIDRIGKSGARFDLEKASWFNQQYLREAQDDVLVNEFNQALKTANVSVDGDVALRIVHLMKERVTFPQELYSKSMYLYSAPAEYEDKVVRKRWTQVAVDMFSLYSSELSGISTVTAEDAKSILENILEQNSVGLGKVMQALRVAITGVGNGPDLMEIISILGPQEVATRLNSAIDQLPVKEQQAANG